MSVNRAEKWDVSPTPTPTPAKKKKHPDCKRKHGETSGYSNIYLFGSDVTYDIYNCISLRRVAYCSIL